MLEYTGAKHKTKTKKQKNPPRAEVEWEAEGVISVYLLPEPQGLAHLCLSLQGTAGNSGSYFILQDSPAWEGGWG